jgi:hypothetical protein
MPEERKSTPSFAVCVRNEGYEVSLERNKIYVVLPDEHAEREGDLRVVDESGEDYLYPADRFVALEVPKAVRAGVSAEGVVAGVSDRPQYDPRWTPISAH